MEVRVILARVWHGGEDNGDCGKNGAMVVATTVGVVGLS